MPYGEGRMGGTRRGTRLTQREAAERLGVSVEAIRKRVKRGTLRSDKGEDGRRYVYLDDAPDAAWTEHQGSELTDELRDRLHYVERQLEAERQAHAEARRIIAGLVERIPALEPPESPETPSEAAADATGPPEPETPTEARPWYRRIFGG